MAEKKYFPDWVKFKNQYGSATGQSRSLKGRNSPTKAWASAHRVPRFLLIPDWRMFKNQYGLDEDEENGISFFNQRQRVITMATEKKVTYHKQGGKNVVTTTTTRGDGSSRSVTREPGYFSDRTISVVERKK